MKKGQLVDERGRGGGRPVSWRGSRGRSPHQGRFAASPWA